MLLFRRLVTHRKNRRQVTGSDIVELLYEIAIRSQTIRNMEDAILITNILGSYVSHTNCEMGFILRLRKNSHYYLNIFLFKLNI